MRGDLLYAGARHLVRFWLWVFFKSIGVRHPERVPATGPALLCINHPNNLIDSLLVGAVVRRKVHYLATAALFRNPLLARFLAACGVIPVYRRDDAPGISIRPPTVSAGLAAPVTIPDRNTEAFAACFRAFERGSLVAIYPEGTTHAEARVQRIKTGAARIALGWEADHPGTLLVVPVGLSFEARKAFGGRVLVSFGRSLAVHPYLDAYREDPAKAVDALTRDVQWAMEAEVVHVERIDAAGLVRALEELYRGELARELRQERGLGPKQIDPLRLSRAIVDAVNHFKTRDPERVERLWQRIQGYRALLAAYRVRDEAVAARARREPALRRHHSWQATVGFPVFAYGALVNGLPYFVPRWLARRLARKETDYATVRLLASIVALPLCWGLEIWAVAWLAGGPAALAFAVSLPLSGLLAYRYLVGAGRLRSRLRLGAVALRQEQATRRLVAERQALLGELEHAKADYLAATRGSSF